MSKYYRINEDQPAQAAPSDIEMRLQSAFEEGPETTRKFLDSDLGKSDTCRELLKNTKSSKNDKVEIEDKPDYPIAKLIPTQNFIDLMQSVSFPLSSKDALVKALTEKKGFGTIIISPDESGILIIDGHHRWSGIFGISPDGKIDAKMVNWPGKGTKQKLAASQLAIAAWLGPDKKLPSATGEPKFNILGKKADEIEKLIIDNSNKPEVVDEKVREMGGLLNDKMINDIVSDENAKKTIYKWCGISDINEKDKEKIKTAIAKKVGENLAKMVYNSEAPGRPDMPQFDPDRGGPKFKEIQSDLEAGNLNIAPPFRQTTESKVIKTYEKFINKWKKGQI